MLKMKQVAKIYRTDTVETHALREFSLQVDEGEFLLLDHRIFCP